MRLNATRLGSIASSRSFGDQIYDLAGQVPNLDLNFAQNKSLIDDYSGTNLVTFTRASSGTFTDSAGVLQTATTNEPRFDHNPTTGESLGLLVEEARTNLLLQSGPVDTNNGWSKGSNTTRIGTETLLGQTATIYQGNGSSANTYVSQSISLVPSTTYTVSVYARLVSGTKPSGGALIIAETSTTRVALDYTAASLTSTVARFSLSFTAPASGGNASIYFVADQNNTAQISIFNAQVEAGAFATSYIPTTTAAATRSADVVSITGASFSSWYNHNEGTLRATASIRGGNTVVSTGLAIINSIAKLAETAVTVNSRAIIFNTATSPNRYTTLQRSAVSNIAINDNTYETIQFGKYYNLSASYVNNSTQGLALSVDGRTVLTNATAVDVPVPTRLLIGAGNAGSNPVVGIDEYYLNGTIKRLTFWPTRLGSEVLPRITQP